MLVIYSRLKQWNVSEWTDSFVLGALFARMLWVFHFLPSPTSWSSSKRSSNGLSTLALLLHNVMLHWTVRQGIQSIVLFASLFICCWESCTSVKCFRWKTNFWNLSVDKVSEGKLQWLRETVISRWSLMDQLVIPNQENDNHGMIYRQKCVELDIWIGWLPAFCDLNYRKS